MPRRADLQRILLIRFRPIVIGQGAEFDYSGNAGGEGAEEEGYEVILVNSNPATIMTDPELADRTYHRAGDRGIRRADHREGTSDALLPTDGRTDRAQRCNGLARDGRHGALRRGAHRG